MFLHRLIFAFAGARPFLCYDSCVLAGPAGIDFISRSQAVDCSGFLSVAEHLLDLGLAASLVALCAGAGKSALRRYEPLFDKPLESLLFSTAAGMGLIATSILLLGLLSLLRPGFLFLLLACHAAIARRGIRELPALAARSWREIKDNASAFDRGLFLVFGVFVISQALLPPLDWDSLMYHLDVPKLFLQEARIFLPPDNLRALSVQLVHMLYLPLMAAGSASGPALLSAFFAIGLGLAGFAFCLRFLKSSTASRSLSVFWASPVLVSVAVTARIDVAVAFFLFLVHYALLRVLLEKDTRPLLLPAAVLFGFALGVKLTAAVYGLALAPLVLLAAFKHSRSPAAAVKSSVVLGLAALITAFPWFLKNWILHRAPFFPYPHDAKIYMEPWLAALYAAAHALPSRNLLEISLPISPHDSGGIVRNVLDLFAAPERLEVFNSPRWTLNLFCLLLPLWMLCLDVGALNWLLIPPLIFAAIVMPLHPYTNARFLAPMALPLVVASIRFAECFLERHFSARAVGRFFRTAAVLALVPSAGLALELFRDTSSLRFLTGAITRRQCLLEDRSAEGGGGSYMNAVSYVNKTLSRRDRVLLLFEARGYYFEIPVIGDWRGANWLLLSQLPSPSDALRSMGVTHVLINYGALDWYVERGLDPNSPEVRLEDLKKFVARSLIPEASAPGFAFYRLKDP